MNLKTILIILLIFSSGKILSQKPKKQAAEVSACMALQEKAWNAFDIDGFMAYYWNSDSLMFIGSKGITYGWKQTHANYKKNYASSDLMGHLSFTNISMEVLSKDAVHVVGKWLIKRKDTEIGGHYSLLWKKINGKWVITRDHTS